MKSRVLPIIVAFLFASMGMHAGAQSPAIWTEPFPPHTIAGNLHYVGSRDLASYLITTREGHILIEQPASRNRCR